MTATLIYRRIGTQMVPLDSARRDKTKKVGLGSYVPIENFWEPPKGRNFDIFGRLAELLKNAIRKAKSTTATLYPIQSCVVRYVT